MSKWVNTYFGNKCLTDTQERAVRVLEEAYELAQAAGITEKEMVHVMKHVLSRPVGDIAQEHAGVMVSLLASATANRLVLEEVADQEIDRIWSVDPDRLYAKQALKNRAGITKYYRGEPISLAEGLSDCHGALRYWGPYSDEPLCLECKKPAGGS